MAAKVNKRPYLQTALFGAVSIGMYALLLVKQDLINQNVAKGGLFAFLPIAMAFLFSFFHGNFTGCFWTSCGVEASKKTKGVK
jgi:F0F1-type ATP synthase assembly protein I